jgi:hypothetical protein
VHKTSTSAQNLRKIFSEKISIFYKNLKNSKTSKKILEKSKSFNAVLGKSSVFIGKKMKNETLNRLWHNYKSKYFHKGIDIDAINRKISDKKI